MAQVEYTDLIQRMICIPRQSTATLLLHARKNIDRGYNSNTAVHAYLHDSYESTLGGSVEHSTQPGRNTNWLVQKGSYLWLSWCVYSCRV